LLDVKNAARFVSMGTTQEALKDPKRLALQRCQDAIVWYERKRNTTRSLHIWLKLTTIILGGATPVLLLWSSNPKNDLLKNLAGATAAAAAIATGIGGAFRPRENYIRFAHVAELLKSELFKYEAGISREYSPLTAPEATVENFALKVDNILLSEVLDWTRLTPNESSEKSASPKCEHR
jgi:hypothetical protein